ncbi:MAG TPA: phage baseplate assembly protein V, partial [Burkholderiales bacterium]|nr:phage baseplate assembly protein V [Burkholderiales bacterium]
MNDITRQLAQVINERKVYGKYRGFVSDNADPEKRGRIKATIPALLGEQITDWAQPCFPWGGLADQGWFAVPEVGAQVWVEFEAGDLHMPIWTGSFWQQASDVPAEVQDQPTTRLMKTPKGHLLVFEDKDDGEQITLKHSGGAQLDIDPKGTIAITDQNGAKITMDADANKLIIEDANGNTMTLAAAGTTVEDANGNKIEMAASGVTVKGAQIVVEGNQV